MFTTTNSTTFLNRWTHFLGAMLVVALMMPAAAVSQSSPVNLGSAGDFRILAKTGISTTGTTQITGDIGVSPAAATSITGFGLIMDASGTFSTSSLVVGNVYAADYTDPTPTKMTTAVSDMETAYTDAAGRASPDYTELFTGDITGQTLTPGLYKWSTGVLVSAGGVTISGSASDVWIFQIAGDLTLVNGAIVALSGGAQASNIFWQVAGQTTLGTTSDFKGIILCKTLIAMQTGATFDGRALAQSAVTLDGNTALPVELTTFSASVKNYTVHLNWETATEVSNYGFDVERSTDKINWSKISFINGHGNSNSTKQYSYTDSKISSGKYYYKLKQIDTDGAFAYSKEIEVSTDELLKDFMVEQNFPNPFNPTTTIKFGFKEPINVMVVIYNALGSEVATLFNSETEAGKIYSIDFDGSRLASGIYYYSISGGNYNSVKKMILMK